MFDMKKINAHGHLLPEPHQIPQFMKDKKVFWIDNDRRFMRQGNWKRPITDPSFFLREKLEWMDENKIQHEVILNLSQLYANGMEKDMCRDVIRFQNDFNAQVQAENPKKITAGFVVQALYIDDALKEIERCVKQFNLQLLCLPTHYINNQGKWQSTAHHDVDPIWDLANKYGLAVEIHPYDAPKMIALKDEYWRFHLIWMCAQTADHYHIFSTRNLAQKYPNLRTCYAHGNQFGQIGYGRRIQGYEGRPDLFPNASHPSSNIQAQNVFFDTLVHDVYSFRLLLDRQGVNQIVAGLDDPYPLGEMEGVGNCYPGKVIDEAVSHSFINDEERQLIWYQNIERWLGKALN